MILIYRDKDEKEEDASTAEAAQEELVQQFKGYMNPYSAMLMESKNIIFHGAPGTGKSYLAKEIAADIISNGYFDDYTLLTDEQKKQVEFVQFHPSYDYTDFVEGLKKYIFIIDEINRGEISKIFGELFFAIDPGECLHYWNHE